MSLDISRKNQTSPDVRAWIDKLKQELRSKNQRLILSIEGDLAFNNVWFQQLSDSFDSVLYLSDVSGQADSKVNKPEHLLGREAQLVVVDFYSGINPDAVTLAAGLVRAGGLLVILSSGLKNWKAVNDRYGIWQDEKTSQSATFAEYFFDSLSSSSAAIRVVEGLDQPLVPDLVISPATEFKQGKTSEQQTVVARSLEILSVRKKSIIAITAARGRGKSTCLGFIARQIFEKSGMKSVITASSRKSAQVALDQAGDLEFFAPDLLLTAQIDADVLLIDEAAKIPYPLLSQLTSKFKKVVMASTTDGYEGTGRGFLLRFVDRFNNKQLTRLDIESPVRWGSKDRLERWINNVFMLDFKPNSDVADKNKSIEFYSLNTNQLHDAGYVESTYRLMMSAHYRSRPSDLRQIMENPDLHFLLAVQHSIVLGVLILNREGGLESELSKEIYFGRRRPKGHLLAQMITAQASVPDFSCCKGLRIIRVAVAEPFRRQGTGSELVRLAESFAEDRGYEYIGACFALDPDMSGFWRCSGFPLLHLGFGEGKSSGSHTALVGKSLNPALEKTFLALSKNIQGKLGFWFIQILGRLDVDSIVSIISLSQYQTTFSELENNEINAFARGYKPLETSLVSLQRLAIQAISNAQVSDQDNALVIKKVIQNQSWESVSSELGFSGRKQIEAQLREIFSGCI